MYRTCSTELEIDPPHASTQAYVVDPFVVFSEISWGGDMHAEGEIKGLVTDPTHSVERCHSKG